MADGDLLLTGTHTGTASVPVSGAGTRMFFDTQKSAFRAGAVSSTEWDNASIGNYSVAMGRNATASANNSTSIGFTTMASGIGSTALGASTTASGQYSTALGSGTVASGDYSTAMGQGVAASGDTSTALGRNTIASGIYSTALGNLVTAGNGTAGSGSGDGSLAIGLMDDAVVITTRPQVTGIQSLGIFMGDQDGLVFSSSNTLGLCGGKMVIDPAVPATQLTARGVIDAGAATDAIVFPSGTTAQRPGTPVNGMTRYNSTTGKFEAYQAGAWVDMIGGGGGSALDSLSDAKTDYVTDFNLFLGTPADAWTAAAGAQYNLAIGQTALDAGLTATGDSNLAIGHNALGANTSGSGNLGIGKDALSTNVAGRTATAVGFEAMRYANSSGTGFNSQNTAFGYQALRGSTTASANTGVNNTAVGFNALMVTTSGTYNTAVGDSTLIANTTGGGNVAIGAGALYTNVANSQSTAIGNEAMLFANDTASGATTYNTAVGALAMRGSPTAANNTGSKNTAIGHSALYSYTSGTSNSALGNGALLNTTTGSRNVAVGDGDGATQATLISNTIGSNNTAVGYLAMNSNVAKNESTAVGYNAMRYADSTVTSSTTYNTALGAYSLQGSATAASNTGTSNTAIGHSALIAVTSGSGNIAIGDRAADALTTGSNNITIGSNIDAVSATGSNQLNIGNAIYGDLSTDKVGIGVVAPSYALDVFGTIKFSSSMIMGSISGAAAPVTSSVALNDLSDVVITAAANGECLTYNGTNWVDGSCGGGGGTPAGADREIQFNSGGAFGSSSTFKLMSDGDLLLTGTYTGTASVPVSSTGTRMFFDTQKAAFRVGGVSGSQWDNANIGAYSVATGNDTIANGNYSTAMGYGSNASGNYSTAMGDETIASGLYSTAMGSFATASGDTSTAMGIGTNASGAYSVAMGNTTVASGISSVAMGRRVTAGNGTGGSGFGDGSMALGLIDDAVVITASSKVTGIQSLGIFMGDQDGLVMSAANTMGVFGGKMVIDPAVPATQLTARGVIDAGAATDAIVFPSGTTAQAPGTPVNGMIRYDTTLGKFRAYQAGAWVDMIGGGGGGRWTRA
ncbi:MAG: hypothetical protein HYU57_06355 [Micavibrio aeruginosavorus]|nr:hypothetical protein [Micavibrio aeruginosavorus]